jgi:hypothetical protein
VIRENNLFRRQTLVDARRVPVGETNDAALVRQEPDIIIERGDSSHANDAAVEVLDELQQRCTLQLRDGLAVARRVEGDLSLALISGERLVESHVIFGFHVYAGRW